MAIPASQIVEVIPRLLSAAGNDLVLNGLMLTKNASIPLSSIAMTFGDPDSVGAFFGMDSDEYALSVVYFKGNKNSLAKPERFMIGRRVDNADNAWVRGAAAGFSLETLKAVTDGALDITIDDNAVSVTGVDLSGAASFSEAATLLQTAIAAKASDTTVTYSSLFKAFTVRSGTTGANSAISYARSPAAGTDLATLLNLTEATGAVLSQGTAAMSVAENFNAIRAVTDNWASFTTLWEADAEEMVELDAWAASRPVQYLYVPWTHAATATVQGSAADPSSVLHEANAGASLKPVYAPSADYAVMVLGMIASINWNQKNSTISLAFKAQDGLAATVNDGATATVLTDKGYNFYGNYSTRNDNFVFLYDGAMFGDYGYADPFINAIWLNNAIQVSIMNGLTSVNRVPYNDPGYTLVRAWIMDVVKRAQMNGVIEAGITLSEGQKAELAREAGLDIAAYLDSDGFYLQILDPGAAVRAKRGSPLVSLWYTYGGSVNRISLTSTAIV